MLPEGSARCVQSFDDSLVLQFAWRIAFHCVLHRYGSQDIHCWKCFFVMFWPACINAYKCLVYKSKSHNIHDWNVIESLKKGAEAPQVYTVSRDAKVELSIHSPWRLKKKNSPFVIFSMPYYSSITPNKLGLTREWQDTDKLKGCGNDPSAGSPTETLLRLHLPLDDEV